MMEAKILSLIELTSSYFILELEAPKVAQSAQAGQFVMLRCGPGYDPLLSRPFSIHRRQGNRIWLLISVVGRGTELISLSRPGAQLEILGPLGKGFRLIEPGRSDPPAQALLVGGGAGVAPLLFLAEELAGRQVPLTVFVGGKTSADLLAIEEFEKLTTKLHLSTEDGSRGEKGLITGVLGDVLEQDTGFRQEIFSCGPWGMLAEISRIAEERQLPIQVSVEARMACGVGACLGCVIKAKAPEGEDYGIGDYRHACVCLEGPVFEAEKLIWN